MALGINTNVASINAQNQLSKSQSQNDQALERLSSGLRINSAKDDAAGLAISTRFESQISGLNQASRNANDGISLAQTAEGGLDEITNNLQRVRELAVQSANATNSASDREALNDEVQQRLEEVDRIASETAFNGLNVLDGSLGGQDFQVGANVGQTIEVNLEDGAKTSQLGSLADSNLDFSGSSGTISLAVGDSEAESIEVASGASGESAISIADSVEGVNGVVSAEASNTQDLTFNTITESSGTAEADFTFSFTAGDGSQQDVSVTIGSGSTLTADNLQTEIDNQGGLDGVSVSESSGTLSFTTDNGENLQVDQTLDSGSITGTIGDTDGGFASADTGTALVGSVDVIADDDLTVTNDDSNTTISGVDGENNFTVGEETTVAAEGDLDGVDVLDVPAAEDAITRIDASLNSVNSIRSELGAVQNRFESTIANIDNTSENLSAANSRIKDADFASESAALAQSQVLQQAGISVLSQANQRPQQVLSLLQ